MPLPIGIIWYDGYCTIIWHRIFATGIIMPFSDNKPRYIFAVPEPHGVISIFHTAEPPNYPSLYPPMNMYDKITPEQITPIKYLQSMLVSLMARNVTSNTVLPLHSEISLRPITPPTYIRLFKLLL